MSALLVSKNPPTCFVTIPRSQMRSHFIGVGVAQRHNGYVSNGAPQNAKRVLHIPNTKHETRPERQPPEAAGAKSRPEAAGRNSLMMSKYRRPPPIVWGVRKIHQETTRLLVSPGLTCPTLGVLRMQRNGHSKWKNSF